MWRIETKMTELVEEFEKTERLIEMEDEYTQKWEDQWAAENQEMLQEEERRLLRKVQTVDDESAVENGCMLEARHVFAKYTDQMSEFADTWERMYDMNVNAIDVDIATLEHEMVELEEARSLSAAAANRLQESIDPLVARKEERERRARIIMYVVRIQAFWRGTMVRRSLGPYRQKKKQAKKSKKSKKK